MTNDNVLPKGAVLHNGKRKYVVEEVLGAGGFGITYKVSSTIVVDNVSINTFFAMKEYFLSSCYRDNDGMTMLYSPTMRMEVEQSLNDFITEAKRLNLLGHKSDNIVKVNEVFKENGTAYYIMEYLEGGNLQEYVRRKGALSEAEAIVLITPIAHAVEALHSERILHLDIKPGNIVLKKDMSTGKSRPVLIDFGLVKHFDSNGKPTTRLASKGASDGFAPMEQYTTIDSFAPTLDVYALGATLYYLLKGKNPPKAFDIESSAVLKDALPVTVSEKTRNAIACAMEKSKFERTPTVSAFLSALSDGESVIIEEPAIEIKTKAKTTRFKDKGAAKPDNEKVIIESEPDLESEPDSTLSKTKQYIIAAVLAVVVVVCGIAWYGNSPNEEEEQTVTDYPIMANDGSVIYRWTGKLTSQNLPEGNGVAIFSSNDKYGRKEYRGDMHNGQMESVDATILYTNGSKYEGVFKRGRRIVGTLTLTEDDMYYTGTFKDGKEYNGKWYFLRSNEVYSEIVNGKEIIK